MTRHRIPTLCTATAIAAIIAFAATLHAQQGSDEKRSKSGNPVTGETDPDAAKPGKSGSGSSGGDAADKPASTPVKPDIRRYNKYYSPIAYLRPRRLAPGQSGEIQIVVMLSASGHAVVLPGSHAQVHLTAENSPFEYGTPVLEPPKVRPDSAYHLGQPIYDDSMVFRVPVTVKADAKWTKHEVTGHVDIELHTEKEHSAIGHVRTLLRGTAWIGKALPDPGVIPPPETRTDRATADQATAESVDTEKAAASDRTAAKGEIDDNAAKPSREARTRPAPQTTGRDSAANAADEGVAADDLQTPAGTVSSILLYVGGGLALVLLILLMASRRGSRGA